jgi:hypothetical protein
LALASARLRGFAQPDVLCVAGGEVDVPTGWKPPPDRGPRRAARCVTLALAWAWPATGQGSVDLSLALKSARAGSAEREAKILYRAAATPGGDGTRK